MKFLVMLFSGGINLYSSSPIFGNKISEEKMNDEFKQLVPLSWQERCKKTAIYHARRCKENSDHRMEDTANELNRSQARISQDIMLANWMKTHPRVEQFKNATQALDYIAKKKKEMKLNEDFD